jgi:hypothetical protein
MIALLVIGGLAPFTFIKGKDGQPLMSFSDSSMPDFSSATIGDTQKQEETVYKWKDKKGVWQYSNEHPPQNITFSTTVYDQNMNVIQALETKDSNIKNALKEKVETTKAKLPDLENTNMPKNIKKLFNDTNNIENLLNDRMKEKAKRIDNL